MTGYIYAGLDDKADVRIGYTQNVQKTEDDTGCKIYGTVQVNGNASNDEDVQSLFKGINKYTPLWQVLEVFQGFSDITGCEYEERGNFQ